MRIAVVTGNPKPGSRTLGVALAVADLLAAALDGAGHRASASSPPSPTAPSPSALPAGAPASASSLPSFTAPPAGAPAALAGAPEADASLPYVPVVPAVGGVPVTPPQVSVPANTAPAAPVHASPQPAPARVGPQGHLVIDLAEHASSLFEPSAAELSRLSAEVATADLVIVASPTYKASYTGMLKAFLDRYGSNGLAGTVAVPVMTGGWPGHLLAVEVHLRPVLVELGATVPARGLYVTEPELATLDAAIAAWAKAAVPLIRRALTGP